MNKKILLILTFLSGLALSYALSISVSPARYILNADKGKVVYGEMMITNESSTDQTYLTSVENFIAQGETGVPLFTKTNKDDKEIASWIQIDSSITVAKGEKKTIPFSVNVPDNAESGGHYASVFLYAKPPEGGDSTVSIGTKVGMLVLFTVNGDIKLGGEIKNFSVVNPRDTDLKPRTFFTELPLTFSYRFTNSGNDRINPYGVIAIKNTFGMNTEILSANPSQGNVLPLSTRKFDVVWGEGSKDTVPDGFFSKAWYQARHFAFGYYTGHLKIAYDIEAKKGIIETNQDIAKNIESSTLNVEKVTKIFILPWQLLAVVVSILIVIFLTFTRGIKRYNKWVIKQAKLSMRK